MSLSGTHRPISFSVSLFLLYCFFHNLFILSFSYLSSSLCLPMSLSFPFFVYSLLSPPLSLSLLSPSVSLSCFSFWSPSLFIFFSISLALFVYSLSYVPASVCIFLSLCFMVTDRSGVVRSVKSVRFKTLVRHLSTVDTFKFFFCNNRRVTAGQLIRTAKKTQHFTITKINWLTLFKEIIAVYSENHMKPINTVCLQNRRIIDS
jgi:hypothetical protein